MPTILDYFTNDFKVLALNNDIQIPEYDIHIKRKVIQEDVSDVRTLVYYIPSTNQTKNIIHLILNTYNNQTNDFNGTVVHSLYVNDLTLGDTINFENLYSRRIYIYHEFELSSDELQLLKQKCITNKFLLTLRGKKYLESKMMFEKPMAFISHDSRDKELIARPIFNGLSKRLTTVWFDEFSLEAGQSLRESIEKGIKEAKKCILILTPNFLSNNGWTKKEFDSIFSREMIFEEKIVIPIWYGVSKSKVFDYSPSLSDTVAIIWPNKDELSIEDYNIEVEKIITKIHIILIK